MSFKSKVSGSNSVERKTDDDRKLVGKSNLWKMNTQNKANQQYKKDLVRFSDLVRQGALQISVPIGSDGIASGEEKYRKHIESSEVRERLIVIADQTHRKTEDLESATDSAVPE